MRRFILMSINFLLIVSILGCSDQDVMKEFDELINGEIETGSKISATGKVAFFTEINEDDDLESYGITDFEIDGVTQVIALVDKNSKVITVYNEINVTDKEVSKNEKLTVEGEVLNNKKDEKYIIKATKAK